jgi:very-short-patch-repair endonuclease
VARIAARRDGAITTAELAAAGIGEKAVARRVADGRLRRVHRGVYLVGPVAGRYAREHAGLLAAGPSMLLFAHTASATWGWHQPGEVVHVAGPRHRRGDARLVVHRATIDPCDVRRRHGLPLTSPARTLLDLAAALDPASLDVAINEAHVAGHTSLRELEALLARQPTHRGAGALAAAIREQPGVTRSRGERTLAALVAAAGLPRPRTNAIVCGWEVDAVWDDARLVVEVDGWGAHGTRWSFERDRRKDADLQLGGYRVLRITLRELETRPHAVVARIAIALGATAGGPRR